MLNSSAMPIGGIAPETDSKKLHNTLRIVRKPGGKSLGKLVDYVRMVRLV
jgi:hypothetical protein